MFRTINTQLDKSVIILDSQWIDQLDYLRRLDHSGNLICPGCHQPVRVRAGLIKRWHFAHKMLLNCPFEGGSPEQLAARAILYQWLMAKFEEGVELEKLVETHELPHPIDCWV